MAERNFYVDKKVGFISSNETLETPKGRLIFPNLKKPSKLSDKYQFRILFPKDKSTDSQTVSKLKAFKALGQELLDAAGKKAKGHKHPPVKDGDDEEDVRFHGHWYIQAGNVALPQLCDIRKEPITAEEFAAGMIVKAIVQPAFFASNGAGISYQAISLMLVKDDGVRIAGAIDGVSAFTDEVSDDEEDEDTSSDLDDLEDEDEAPKSKKKPTAKAKPAPKARSKKKVVEEEEDDDDLDEDEEEEEEEDDSDLDDDSEDEDQDDDSDDEDEDEEEEEEAPKAKAKVKGKKSVPTPPAKKAVAKKKKDELSSLL